MNRLNKIKFSERGLEDATLDELFEEINMLIDESL